ncbi:MAG TPA: DUF3291 domain-containing protein [Thermohalobaculum sp.]|nr:DUF3291 domain-containing protein [Thermohalobaculum sp.]
MPDTHLAQLNIGRFRFPTDDPRMSEFMDNLDRVNALADRSPGFVWRMQDDSGNATAIPVTPDPMMAANLSVWTDVASLEHFVWNTAHRRFYRRRADWFGLMDSMHFVMWRVATGDQPSLAEAMERLEHLNRHGSTDHAFGWDHLPEAKLWRAQHCAGIAAE